MPDCRRPELFFTTVEHYKYLDEPGSGATVVDMTSSGHSELASNTLGDILWSMLRIPLFMCQDMTSNGYPEFSSKTLGDILWFSCQKAGYGARTLRQNGPSRSQDRIAVYCATFALPLIDESTKQEEQKQIKRYIGKAVDDEEMKLANHGMY
ncbi:hypothetical protein PoB_001550400 [Plakobranchus ocellatus]|uniref:Uncharacterized protein n=1 Tax=Plakobranchus ocellatus TaxID=259542 RepID=A0AAV3Z3N6_9GAST|nr:hypothetical protein PoB_001550400 [Plakobranchus ocellatus]